MVLVAVRLCNLQLLLEESLPAHWELALDQVSHDEELFLGAALKVEVRHLLVDSVFLVVGLEDERSPRLLETLDELEVHQLKLHHIVSDDQLRLEVHVVDALLLHVRVHILVLDLHGFILNLQPIRHGEEVNARPSNHHLLGLAHGAF